MMGHGRMGNLFNQETLKPKSISETLMRLGRYFSRFSYMLVLAALFIITATWSQVTTPELTGQATDCFLVPAGASAFGSFAGAQQQVQASESACWLQNDTSTLSGTRWIIAKAFTLGGYQMADPATSSSADRIAGLGRLILILIGLSIAGSLLNGATFFTMSWTGQHVLRQLRVEVFQKLHQLSLSYYSEHEAGDLMSRITNDTSAIEQAISFALVNVLGGILLLAWVTYNMLTANLPFALLSLAVAPLMFLATLYFSDQARKAFRTSRKEIGNVNAELQESIAAVREVQAFNRADENIEQFKVANAANRDANVRAVSFTSALGPALEALSYLSLAIVTGVGGWYLLKGQTLLGTTDVDHGANVQTEPHLTEQEFDYLMMAALYAFRPAGLHLRDVQATLSGIRPVVDTGQRDPSKESRESVLWDERGLLTIAGGKLTTFRLMAHDALKAVRSSLPGAPRFPRGRVLDAIPGAMDDVIILKRSH